MTAARDRCLLEKASRQCRDRSCEPLRPLQQSHEEGGRRPRGLAFHCTKALSPILKSLAAKDAVLQLQDLFRGAASGFVERGPLRHAQHQSRPSVQKAYRFQRDRTVHELPASPVSDRADERQSSSRSWTKAKVLSAMPCSTILSRVAARFQPDEAQFRADRLQPRLSRERGNCLCCADQPWHRQDDTAGTIVRAYQGQYGPESVIGASMAWMQAIQSRSALTIEPFAIASLLATKSDATRPLRQVKLVIVDEAGLLPSKNMDDS